MGKHRKVELYYVYCLRCPFTQDIKYIGYTGNLGERFYGHLMRGGDTDKSKWIKSLKEREVLPVMEVIETTQTKEVALLLEAIHICENIQTILNHRQEKKRAKTLLRFNKHKIRALNEQLCKPSKPH